MKYSESFIKRNKKFPTEDVRQVLEVTDAHYPTMVKLVGFYNVCKRKLPRPSKNPFRQEMESTGITEDMLAIASEYFRYAKQRDKAALRRYLKKQDELYAPTR